jgi:hypothetical protein
MTRSDLPGIELRTSNSVGKNLMNGRGKFYLIDTGAVIVPWITFIGAPGHTPGNILSLISSTGERIICFGDMLHDPLELKIPELYKSCDMLSKEGTVTRGQGHYCCF